MTELKFQAKKSSIMVKVRELVPFKIISLDSWGSN